MSLRGKFLVGVCGVRDRDRVRLLVYVRFVRIPQNVAYVSEEDGGIVVIDLNSLKIVKRVHPKDTAPRGIGITFDGKYLDHRQQRHRRRERD